MKLKAFCLAVSLVLASLISIATFAHGQTIDFEFQDGEGKTVDTVNRGDSFFVVVTVDNASGVASAALTVEYDENNFEVEETNEASGNYFVAASDMFNHPVDDNRDPPGEPQQAFPSFGNKETPGEVLLSGAYINADPNNPDTAGGGAYTGKQDLFAVRFKVIEYAHTAPSSHTFTVKQTEILNADAGWGTDGTAEPIPVLVGAVPKSDTDNWDDLAGGAFPGLLPNDDNPFSAVDHEITVGSGENQPPEADAGDDQTVEEIDGGAGNNVIAGGPANYDYVTK